MAEQEKKNLRISMPLGLNSRNDKYHVFDNNKSSLCGRWRMPALNDESSQEFTGKETFNHKDDCKTCFKKAGIEIPAKKV